MKVFSKFKFNIDKKRVVNSVSTYCNLPSSDMIEKTFEELKSELYGHIHARGVYKLLPRPEGYGFEVLDDCEDIFFCAITMGDDSTKRVDSLFNEGKFFEAILMDSMANMLLFDYTRQLHDEIFKAALRMGCGITCRISPGDGEIPIEYQGDILERIGDAKRYGIFINNGYLLEPQKSMTFIYGAGRNIPQTIKDHDCLRCSNINCSMREIY